MENAEDLPQGLLNQIAHFFAHYKDLEEGKWVKVEGWSNAEAAKAEILASVRNFQNAPEKPNFFCFAFFAPLRLS